MKNIFMTNDPRVDFIIENYKKVVDLQECYELTTTKYPVAIKNEMLRLLKDMDYEKPFIDKDSIIFFDPNEKYYDYDRDVGVFYQIGYFNWETLTASKEEDGIEICSWVDKNNKLKNFKSWLEKTTQNLKSNRNKLKNYITSFDENDCCVKMYLHNLLSVKNLSKNDFEKIRENLRKKIKQFTSILTGENGIIQPFH